MWSALHLGLGLGLALLHIAAATVQRDSDFGPRRLDAGYDSVMLGVSSAGYSDGDSADFFLGGERLNLTSGLGLNVLTLAPNASITAFRTFNTHDSPSAAPALVSFLDGLAPGALVLVAVKDEAQTMLSSAARTAIAGCGATFINKLEYRSSYAFIGVKGGNKLGEVVRPENASVAATSFLYRLPALSATGPVNLKVVSEGYNSQVNRGGTATFYLDNTPLTVTTGRGMNVVVLAPNGTFNTSHIFDTHDGSGSGPLVDFISSLLPGTPVLIAARDDAKPGLTEAARDAIRSCGGTMIGDLRYRSAYALVGLKDSFKLAEAVMAENKGPAEVLAQYELGMTTTVTSTTTTTSEPPPCLEFSCPTGQVLKLGAAELRGLDEAACCDAAGDDVVGLLVKSAGWRRNIRAIAEFHLGGQKLSFSTGRGMNVVVLQQDGTPVRAGQYRPQTFDTNQVGPAENLTALLDSLENGTVVLIAAKDEAKYRLTSQARAAIQRCGGQQIDQLAWRGSYALIGVKGRSALAEVILPPYDGVAVAIAHLQIDPSAVAKSSKPVCEARVSNPPVSGWVANRQLELEAGCRYRLWEGPQAGQCLEGSWMAVVGGSNTVLMALQLANMLAPEAILPVRDGATMGGFTVVDVIVRNGRVDYANHQKLPNCTALPYNAQCQASIAAMVAEAPAYDASAGGTRITLFEARFWDHADVAMQTLVSDTRWASAPLGLLVQVSTWYIYCASMKLSWCPRDELERPDLSHAQALDLFKADMAPVLSKMETLCVANGRAGKHGCWVATTSWQNPSASRLPFYNDYNSAIVSALDGKTSEVLRIVDLWALGQAFPEQNILGHGSPLLNLWNWQVMLGGMCPPEQASQGTFAEFEGELCFGSDAKRVQSGSGWDLAATTGAKCPNYWNACPTKGGSHLRCEPWECANSVPCKLVAVVRDQVEANLTGACYDNITADFAAVPYNGLEEPCSRIWCDSSLQFLPAVLAVALVILLFSSGILWRRYAPERLKQRVAGLLAVVTADTKAKTATPKESAPAAPTTARSGEPSASSSTALAAAAQSPAQVAAPEAATTDPNAPSAAGQSPGPALLLNLESHARQPSFKDGEAGKAASSTKEDAAGPSVVVSIKDEQPSNTPAEAAPKADATPATKETPKKAKGAGDKFPLGLARMCASLHVVVGHLYAKGGVVPDVYFFGWGFTWVPWFFMLSGFVLFTAHLRRPKEEGVFEYVLRRSVTIYPLYAFSLIPAFIIAKTLDNSPSAIILVAQSWLLQAWSPFWTERALQMHCWFLSAMVVYWFLFKPLARCLRGLSLRSTVLLMAFLFFLPWLVVLIPAIAQESVTWYSRHASNSTRSWLDVAVVFLKFNPACYLHVFVLGMLLAKLRLQLDARAVAGGLSRRWRLPMEFVAPAGYAGLFVIFFGKQLQPWGYKLSTRLSVLLPFQAAVLFGLAGLPSLPQGKVAAFASKFDFLENYSYAVYVFQFICYAVWPKQRDINLLFFLVFLVATAVFVVHMVQRPVQRWWSKHPRARWAIPILLSLTLGSLELLLPHNNRSQPLPALIRHDAEMIDVRLALREEESNGGFLMNPSILVKDGQVHIAVRQHRLEISQRIDDGSCIAYNSTGCTIIDQTWHSEILLGSAPFDNASWANWTISGQAPFEATVRPWRALRTADGQPWAQLCVSEEFISRNNTLIRHVVTGPEDPKLVSLSSNETAVVFSSRPPLGADGCQASLGLAPVTQMYMARLSLDPEIARGHRLEYGSTTEHEKNWIPFATPNGTGLHFAYKPEPHEIISCQTSGNLTCEVEFASPFQALRHFQTANPGLVDWRGSAQAVLIDAGVASDMPRKHYLGLLHAVEKRTKRYAHFAYRFTAEAPYSILEVSAQLPLQKAVSDGTPVAMAFASGLSVEEGIVTISYGAGDRDARALVLTMSRLDEFFRCAGSRVQNGDGSTPLAGNASNVTAGNATL